MVWLPESLSKRRTHSCAVSAPFEIVKFSCHCQLRRTLFDLYCIKVQVINLLKLSDKRVFLVGKTGLTHPGDSSLPNDITLLLAKHQSESVS